MVAVTNCNCIALLFLCIGLLQLQKAANIAIVPSLSNHSCPANEVCYSLSQLYDTDSSDHFQVVSNTTLEFFNLQYKFESTILIRDVNNLKLICTSAPGALCQLHCDGNGSFVFMNITNLWFSGFIMYDCGGVIRKDLGHEATVVQVQLYHTFVFGLKAAVFAVNVKNLIANWNVINGSYGYSILGLNVIGNSSFDGLLIGFSNFRSFNKHCLQWSPLWNPPLSEMAKCQGGSALFLYNDLPYCPDSVERYTLTLRQTQILKGFDPVGGNYGEQFIVHGSGLGIIMTQSYFDVDVYILGAKLVSNNALASEGSNLYLRLLGKVLYSTITVHDSYIAAGSRVCIDLGFLINFTCDSYSFAGAVAFTHGTFSNFTPSECKPLEYINRIRNEGTTLSIENSVFDQNLGGGFFISIDPSLIQEDRTYNTRNIAIRGCRIIGSVCVLSRFACSMQVMQGQKYGNQIEYHLIIQNTTFIDNKFVGDVLTPSGEYANGLNTFGVIIVIAFENITFINCSFLENQTPSLLAYESQVYFEGTNIFDSNTAVFGGAIYLERNSFILLRPNTTMLFRNNVATLKGGAIYIAGDNSVNFFYKCPIQIYDPLLTQPSKLGIVMKFVNNTALGSGDALYGGQIDRCLSTSTSGFLSYYKIVQGSIIFDNITNFSEQPSSDSLISSDVLQICLCDKNKPNCNKKSHTINHYPGERFQISIIALGQRGGTVSAVVFTRIVQLGSFDRNYQLTNRTCSNATYTLASSQPQVHLYLSAENTLPTINNLSSTAEAVVSRISPIVVQVNMIPCSNLTGFMLDENSETCDCTQPLRDRNMTCDINTKIITRLPPYWLSNYSNYLLLHDNCPYDYCKPTVVPLIMIEPNISDQCAFNRHGTLCGLCQEGLSQVFGTSKCLKCSNIYVFYIFLFAAAGIILVVALLLFNLTVSKGALNGLIFYANIVKINESVLFPPGDISPFKVFISWLNLDLGIETCFYSGMESTGKTWLQFLFPLYLWLILAAIIVACRYSITMARLVGNHAVEVLATTFLLSYTKLLRTIITVFSSTTLVYPEGQRSVWLYDGNYQFGKGGHLALLFFSVLIFALIALPYTVLIVSIQFLRRYSHIRLLKWVTKLMPVFDAYLGPYKHKHGYWNGLLLLVRVLLVVVFAINVLSNPAINLFVIRSTASIIIVLNLGMGGVYKNKLLTALEIFYIANLLAVASATSLTREGSWDQRYVIYSSVTLAMLAFFATIAYQTVLRIKVKVNQLQVQRKGYVLQNTNSDLHIGFLESITKEVVTQVKQKTVLVTETVIDGKPDIELHYNTI